MISLAKGQTIRLEKSGGGGYARVTMGLGWDVKQAKGLARFFGGGGEIDLDASALLFDADGAMIDQVWFRQLRSRDGAVVHSGDNRTGEGDGDDERIAVDLTALPAAVRALVFTVNSFTGETFEQVANAFCRLVDQATGQEIARYDLSAGGRHTGQVMARMSRTGGGWELKAIGEKTTGRTFHDMMPTIRSAL